MSTTNLHTSLLRIPIIQILRSAGFHGTKPSVLDTLVNLTERYLLLLASTTASHASRNHNSATPTLTDLRMAFAECGVTLPAPSGAEEDWIEKSRRGLSEYEDMPYGDSRRIKIVEKRDQEDTADVTAFVEWVKGDRHKEMRRIAGLLSDAMLGDEAKDDYLSALKKKHSKTGGEARYAGTVLGKTTEPKQVELEGGPGFEDWVRQVLEAEMEEDTI